MKHAIATTPEQSARLIACGIDPISADMSYTGAKNAALSVIPYKRQWMPKKQPAWSLSALLALLPKEIVDEGCDDYYLALAKEFPLTNEFGVSYRPCWYEGDSLICKHDNSPIEACVQMIEWLTKDGYKLNELTNE